MEPAVSGLADITDRLRALDEHGSTLLVEAAAGTGKTSLIAGRVTLLLASGVSPSSIAAITFTESAATDWRTASGGTCPNLSTVGYPRSSRMHAPRA